MATSKLGKILDKIVPIDSNHYREQKKLLWTNASPSSQFGAQKISLDLSSYDEVEIQYAHTTGAWKGTGRAKKGQATEIYTPVERNYYRVATVSSSGVSFGLGYVFLTYGSWSTEVNSGFNVPLRIYGIINS